MDYALGLCTGLFLGFALFFNAGCQGGTVPVNIGSVEARWVDMDGDAFCAEEEVAVSGGCSCGNSAILRSAPNMNAWQCRCAEQTVPHAWALCIAQ